MREIVIVIALLSRRWVYFGVFFLCWIYMFIFRINTYFFQYHNYLPLQVIGVLLLLFFFSLSLKIKVAKKKKSLKRLRQLYLFSSNAICDFFPLKFFFLFFLNETTARDKSCVSFPHYGYPCTSFFFFLLAFEFLQHMSIPVTRFFLHVIRLHLEVARYTKIALISGDFMTLRA